MKKQNKLDYNKVYDILVLIGGANENERGDFVYNHTESKYGCNEWRFMGHFGFGGKYRSSTNTIDYYREDETPKLNNLQNQINTILQSLYNE